MIQLQFVWKLGDNCEPNWPVEDGYVIEIDGDPDVRLPWSRLKASRPRHHDQEQ